MLLSRIINHEGEMHIAFRDKVKGILHITVNSIHLLFL